MQISLKREGGVGRVGLLGQGRRIGLDCMLKWRLAVFEEYLIHFFLRQ